MPHIYFLLITLLWTLALCTASQSDGRSEAFLYLTRPPTPAEAARNDTRAKYEPVIGCYLGAFIDFDSTLRTAFRDQNRTPHHDPAAFEGIVGKPHAMYFFYLGYGRPLPLDWVRELARRNKFVHIALEPNGGLAKVKEDAYLQRLADDMARSGAKIFLRFASEMNGDWTAYSKDPKLYREKFRLVHSVMRRRAPNVATVWCPYSPYIFTHRNVNDYYPGNDGTDWVGINMYSVTFHNNDPKQPAAHEHPCDLLDSFYRQYAARKPVMICEFAATHYAKLEGQPCSDFAMRKILTFYTALSRRYPRVKCINYFDGNALEYAAERATNDYSVTNDPLVTAAYRYAISNPFFLPAPLPSNASPPAPVPLPLRNGDTLQGKARLSCWARSPSDILSVRYKLDGYLIYKADRPDLWECIWDAGSVRPGKHTLLLEVLNARGKVVEKQSLSILTKP